MKNNYTYTTANRAIKQLHINHMGIEKQEYFSEYGLLGKMVSNVGTTFIAEKLENFCKCPAIWHDVSSSYSHQGIPQAVACITFVQRTVKCQETNADIHVYLLKIRSTLVSPGLLGPVMCLFNRPTRYLLPRVYRTPIMCDNDESNHAVLSRQPQ